MPHLLIY